MKPNSKKAPEPSPSRKRLLPDRPNPEATLPSGPLRLKKTRDLPNVFECGACNRRTDLANGTNRMRVLYSEWRIVLLCKRCYSRVGSRQICSYCFKEASSDCFSCGKCSHFVHKTCFFEYKSVPPWSFSSSGNDFSVCIDCWLPVHIVGKRENCIRKDGDARVLDDGVGTISLDRAVKDANVLVEEKVETAARARDMATKKAETARHVLEMAGNALGVLAKKNVFNDTTLALQLHKAITSCPRISKNENMEPVVFSCLERMKKPVCQVYVRRRRNGKCQQISVGGMPGEEGGSCCSEMMNSLLDDNGKVKPTRLFYSRTRKHGEGQQNSCAEVQVERQRICCTELTIASGSDNKVSSMSKCQDNSSIFTHAISEGKQDRYLFKYRRKTSRSGRGLVCQTSLLDDCSSLEHHSSVSQVLESAKFSNASSPSFPLQESACTTGSC